MTFYQLSGHRDDSEPTCSSADDIVRNEASRPNATLDATRILRAVSKWISPARRRPTILDVGCGYGFFSREAVRLGFQVHALELAANERAIARDLSGVEAQCVSFEDFQAAPGSFAAILMSQILEHALDVNIWAAKANELLCDSGVLAIALPNFGSVFRYVMQDREPYICPPAHLNFFTDRSLRRLLERHGFEVLATTSVSRIPSTTFEKRLPRLRRFAHSLSLASRVALTAVDLLKAGQILNVYARKVSR